MIGLIEYIVLAASTCLVVIHIETHLYTNVNQRRLYIMTLGCLSPYRRLGIGTVMFEHIMNFAEKDGNFDSIFL